MSTERATVDFMGQPALNPLFDHYRSRAARYPFQVLWSDGSSAGRYATEYAAKIKAETIDGSFRYSPES